MSYTFDIVGVAPVLKYFYYQQQVEKDPKRSRAYLGSHECTLDAFIRSTEIILQKPDWDWDAVAATIVDFWLQHSERVQHWKTEIQTLGEDNLLIARVANLKLMRRDLECLWQQ